jgi:hypothetical protein
MSYLGVNKSSNSFRWAGSEKKPDDRFPKDKQFLVTKKVPSYKRIKDLESSANTIKEHDIGDGWILPEQQPD